MVQLADFRLLGPVEVRVGSRSVPIGGTRTRGVLATLLLNAGRMVSIDQLAEAAWGGDPPAGARVQVQNRISALRRALRTAHAGTNLIDTCSSGYLIRPGDGQLDLDRFRRLTSEADTLAAAGRAADAVERLTAALDLRRGPVLDGLTTPYLTTAARSIEESLTVALEKRIRLHLHRGRHAAAIAELTALADAYPYRERLHALLMLALFRDGRQAEALAVYRRARSMLVDQLGVEPGALLRRLNEAILRPDTSLDPAMAELLDPVPPADAVPAPGAPAAEAAPAPGAPTAEAAPAGTGAPPSGPAPPTSAARPADADPVGTDGGAVPPDAAPAPSGPYRGGPPADPVRPAVESGAGSLSIVDKGRRGAGIPAPRELPADVAGFTGRMVELGRLDRLVADGATGDPVAVAVIAGTPGVGKTALAVHWAHRVAGRFPDGQLFLDLRGHSPGTPLRPVEALAALLRSLGVPPGQIPAEVGEAAARYRSALAGRRVLILLDNAGSVQQVRPLLPGAAGCLVVVTTRDRLAGLVAREGAHRLTLDVLTPGESHTLLARLLGRRRVRDEPAAVAALAQACAHLPLALRIAAATLLDRPHRPIEDHVGDLRAGDRLDALAVDGDGESAVGTAFDLSYRSIPVEARRLFRLIGAVPGFDIDVPAAAALAGAGPERTSRLLDVLAGAHLIGEHTSGRYAPHDLLRRYAAERARAEDGAVELRSAVERLAGHYQSTVDEAAALLYPEKVRLPQQAGAATPGGPRQAGAATPGGPRQAGAATPGGPDPGGNGAGPPVRGSAPGFADRAAALSWLDAERANLVAMVAHATRHGPRGTAWRLADALRGYFHLRLHQVDWLTVASTAVEAAAADGNGYGEAAAHLSLADLHWRRGDRAAAARHATRALSLAERIGWLDGAGTARGSLASVAWLSGELEQAAVHLEQALLYSRRTGRRYSDAVNTSNLGLVYADLGLLDQARDRHLAALAVYRRSASPAVEATTRCNLGEVYHVMGRYRLAEQALRQALALSRDVGDRLTEAESLRCLARTDRVRGRLRAADRHCRAALDLFGDLNYPRGEADALNTLGSIDLARGAPATAVAGHERALRVARASGDSSPRVNALVGLALSLPPDRADRAAACAAEAVEIARQRGLRVLEARALTVRAELCLASGSPAAARPDAEAALQMHRRSGHRFGQYHALHALARALGSSARASDLRRAARALAGTLGIPDSPGLAGRRTPV